MRTADNIGARKAPEKARRDVLLKFGNPTVMREGVDFALNLDIFFRDVQYAFRKLRKTPAFAITVILTLALDIGGPSVYQVANFRFVGNTEVMFWMRDHFRVDRNPTASRRRWAYPEFSFSASAILQQVSSIEQDSHI
jgi:hypothetical protein